MAIKIKFDAAHNPQVPTIVLAKKNGDKLGQLNAKEIEVSDSLNDASEITFTVYKNTDGKECPLWDEIVDFKLVYCVEWNMWFEITVELDEANEIKKTVFCTQLGQAELSQIMLYDIEINTEDDIARDDYEKPTILYDEKEPENSLLNRIMEKAPHYSISRVDDTIAGIQRTFTFDDTSIYDAFQDIAEEIGCLFVFPSCSDEYGDIQRVIDVYDLESNCRVCGYRGEFTLVCPECGATGVDEEGKNKIIEGYGKDTTIFVTSDELTDEIQLTTDTDAVKNCFKLEAGDDLMTAAIRSCNPNGTDYIWHISDSVKKDMPKEMVDRLKSYDDAYKYYMYNKVENEKDRKPVASINSELVEKYNKLVDKYNVYKTGKDESKIEKIGSLIYTYPDLMKSYYNTIDLEMFLEHSLMPGVTVPTKTNAKKEAAKLSQDNIEFVAVSNLNYASRQTVDNAVLAMAKVLVSSKYKIKVCDGSSFDKNARIWIGNFELTNYSDEKDNATSDKISVPITDNVKSFIEQKIEKALSKDEEEDLSITGLFKLSASGDYNNPGDFELELKKYSLNYLNIFYDSCRGVLDILIEQGVADNSKTWSGGSGDNSNLYNELYLPYLTKYRSIEYEINVRQNEINIISGTYKVNGDLIDYGIQTYIEESRDGIQKALDFEDFMGKNLWLQFCAFRREDKYSNDNYISDGLDNAELFSKALEFIEVAKKEIYKSAELQHSISANLKNLLAIKKFEPIVNDFKVGNWLRVMIDDELYKLRLTKYDIDYDDFDNISVEFSDVVKAKSNTQSIQDVLDQASSMATSYDAVQRQAEQGNSGKDMLNSWVNNGLSLTNMKIVSGAENQDITWDSHGLLCREWLPIEENYDEKQLKIINHGLYVTDNNWETSRAGIGNFVFVNPETGVQESHYGVIADMLVGNTVLSKKAAIYSESNSIKLDNDGLSITINKSAGSSVFQKAMLIKSKTVNPDTGTEKEDELMYVDSSGNLVLNGSIKVKSSETQIGKLSDYDTSGLSSRLSIAESKIEQNASNIKLSVSKTEFNELSKTYYDSQFEQTADAIQTRVENGEKMTSLTQTVNGFSASIKTANDNANSALERVGDAEKKATNYLEYTSNGLIVGNKSSGSWSGYRTRISSSSFDVLDSSGNELASYGANKIELGKNSKSSVISMCNGQLEIGYKANSGSNYQDVSYITRPDGNGYLSFGVGGVNALMIDGGKVMGGTVVNRVGSLAFFTANNGFEAKGYISLEYESESSGDREIASLVDFVTQSGTINGWKYIKYANGMCIAIYEEEVSLNCHTQWGNLYFDTTTKGYKRYPFTIYDAVPHIAIHTWNGGYFPALLAGNGNSYSPKYYICGASDWNQTQAFARYLVVGKWKQ